MTTRRLNKSEMQMINEVRKELRKAFLTNPPHAASLARATVRKCNSILVKAGVSHG